MPRHFRSLRRLLLGAALVLALLGGLLSPAHADTPSPSPTPSASATPTASPESTDSPTDAPTPTAPDTSSPASTPSTSSTPSPPTPSVVTHRRTLLPDRFQQIVDLAVRAGTAAAPRFRSLAEEDSFALVIPSCATPTGTTTALAIYATDDELGEGEVAYSVTDAGGVEVDSGTVTLEQGSAEFELDELTVGEFTIAFTPEGQAEPTYSTTFTVLGCLTTTVSCKAVTFTNPAGNPLVGVFYGPAARGDEFLDEDDEDFATIDPGASVTLRTARTAISYIGVGIFPDDDEDEFTISLAGEVPSLAVPGDCERPLSTLNLSCVDDQPRLGVTLAREGSDQPIDITVRNSKGKVVARTSPRGRDTTVALKLPGPGRYTYRSYFDTDLAYEKVTVNVVSCGASAAPAGDGLADTGAPPLLPLPIGAALLGGAVLLLTRRTRPAR